MALFKRQPRLTKAIQAALARAEWRAQLHELNDDSAGAAFERLYADEAEAFALAKLNRIDAEDPNYLAAETRYRAFRDYWRNVRAAFPRDMEMRVVMNELEEPSDEELLA